jgi:hypothetical protein
MPTERLKTGLPPTCNQEFPELIQMNLMQSYLPAFWTFPGRLFLLCGILAALSTPLNAQEHQAETIENPPPAEEVQEEFVNQVSDKGVRVKRGSRTVCEIWFNKEWKLDEGFTATPERLYPFVPGQLIGLLHFPRRGSDFRNQNISSGWYTLRFALQPIDGNHVGTSPTRDFVVMVQLENDELGKDWSETDLQMASAEAAGSTHPAMMGLQKASEGESPSMRHEEGNDWWILHFVGKATKGSETVEQPLDLIVAGHAIE